MGQDARDEARRLYALRDLSKDGIRNAIAQEWAALDPGELEGLAREHGASDEILGAGAESLFDVREPVLGEANLVGEAVAVAIFFAPALNEIAEKVAIDIWERLIFPRLLQRFGESAVEPVDEADSADSR